MLLMCLVGAVPGEVAGLFSRINSSRISPSSLTLILIFNIDRRIMIGMPITKIAPKIIQTTLNIVSSAAMIFLSKNSNVNSYARIFILGGQVNHSKFGQNLRPRMLFDYISNFFRLIIGHIAKL